MARPTGKLTDKVVGEWFSGLEFGRQLAVLGSLQEINSGVRRERIEALRRELDALEVGITEHQPRRAAKTRTRRNGSIAVKYRDPKTGDTWSGRGRMARWLSEKVKAGEKADKYLV